LAIKKATAPVVVVDEGYEKIGQRNLLKTLYVGFDDKNFKILFFFNFMCFNFIFILFF
jgi:hypothetical protein